MTARNARASAVVVIGMLVALLAPARTARATDIFSLHLDGAVFVVEPDHGVLSAGAGLSYEVLLQGMGLRFGAVTAPLLALDRGDPLYAWTLGPELAFFVGGDSRPTHWMISAQALFALARVDAGDRGAVQGLRIGPEFEVRHVPAGMRARIGLLYAPTRLPDGRFAWGAGGVRISFELGKPAQGIVEPEGDQRCPDGRARLVGTGCN